MTEVMKHVKEGKDEAKEVMEAVKAMLRRSTMSGLRNAIEAKK